MKTKHTSILGLAVNCLACICLLGGFAHRAAAQTLTTLVDFAPYPDEPVPIAGLVQGSDGNFYGTTEYGGTNNFGLVYRITPAGIVTYLHQFPDDTNDGKYPEAGLVQGFDSNLYGTTSNGGSNGFGTVFKITLSGSLTRLHDCSLDPTDGYEPVAGLVQGVDSNFYGTTSGGGTNNWGTVFRMTPSGSYTSLWQFGGGPIDGRDPQAGLVQGVDSNFYGTTYYGGTNDLGTVFKITPCGNLTTLWQFSGNPIDGSRPLAGLVQGIDGNFYGTTSDGGTNDLGTVFKITSAGSLTTLWQFSGDPIDGAYPAAGLVQGSDTNFYGTTFRGGTNDLGTIFAITPGGALTTLWQFDGQNSSEGPTAGLTKATGGNFYGTTSNGHGSDEGSVFRFSLTCAGITMPDCAITANPGLTICQGRTTILTAPNGKKQYLWHGPEKDGAAVQTIVVGTPGTYTCTTVNYYGPTNTCCVSVVVNPAPPCLITGGPYAAPSAPATLCGPDGMASYVWLSGPQFAGSTAKCITVTVAGTYTLRVTDSNGCVNTCSTTLVNNVPQPCFITGNTSVCQGLSTVLTAPNGMVSYAWTGPNGFLSSHQFIVVATGGVYSVTQVDGHGRTNNCSAPVTILPPPSCLIYGPTTICQGQTTTLVGPAGMKSQYWLGPQNNGLNTRSNTVSTAGTYTLHVVSSNGCENACSVALTTIPCPP